MKTKAILLTKKIFLTILIILPILLLTLFIALKIGFEIESIQTNSVQIDKAYIKLKRKLHLSVEKITVKGKKKSSEKSLFLSQEDIHSAERLFFLSYFFENIEIKNLEVEEEKLSIRLNSNILKAKSDKFDTTVLIGWNDPNLSLIVKDFHYYEHNITASGDSILDLSNNQYKGQIDLKSSYGNSLVNFNGNFEKVALFLYNTSIKFKEYDFKSNSTKVNVDLKTLNLDFSTTAVAMDIMADVKGTLEGNLLTFSVTNAFTESIKKLISVIPLHKRIKEWIVLRPKSNEYYVREARMKLNIKNGFFDMDYFYLNMLAGELKLKFNDSLPEVYSPITFITIKEGLLSINADNAKYLDKEIDLKVDLGSLKRGQKRVLKVGVKTDESLDSSVFDIPRAYGVDLSIDQLSGNSDTEALIELGLNTNYFNIDVNSYIYDAQVDLNGLIFNFNTVDIKKRKEKVVVEADITSPINNRLRFTLEGNMTSESITSDVFIKSYRSPNGVVIDLKDTKSDLYVDWKDGVRAVSNDLNLSTYTKDGKFTATYPQISKLLPSSFLLKELSVIDGKAVVIGDAEKVVTSLEIENSGDLLYNKNGAIRNVDVHFVKKENDMRFDINKNINIDLGEKKNNIYITNTDVNMTKIKKLYDKLPKKSVDKNKVTTVSGYNSNIIFKKNVLKSDWYSATIAGDNASLDLKKNNSRFQIKKDGNEITIRGKKIDSEFSSSLSNVKVLGKDGHWSIIGFGDLKNEEVYGVIKINNMIVKEAAGVMNIVALLNTIPALIQFKSPGFTSDGYEIKSGIIDFYYGKNKLFIKAIRLTGTNTDIIGQGTIDLDSKEIDIDLSVNTIKGLSSIIGNIPIIGYLLLDKEKTIGTMVKIGGTMKKPKVKSNVAGDLFFYPLQIIKRVLLLPQHLISSDEEELEKSDFSK